MSAGKNNGRANSKSGYLQNVMGMSTSLVLILNTFLEHIRSNKWNLMLVFIAFVLDWKYPFGQIWSKKSKLRVSAEIWQLA